MAGIKNKYDFYKGFLEAIGAEGINETDYKNEEELRKKILDTLDVEYVFDDVNQTDLFREKFLQGIGSGGGGSSDFSTAEVTVILTENQTANFGSMPTVEVGENAGDIYNGTIASEAGVHNIVLYKGLFDLVTNTDTFVSVTGDATYEIDQEYGDVIISVSGDCSITINREQMG